MKKESGQALIVLLAFVAMSIVLISGAITVTILNSQSTSQYAQGEESYAIAQSGIENAIVKVLRDSSYSGETLSIDNGTVTISVSGSSTKTITSESTLGNFKRKIQVVGDLSNNIFTTTTWQEIN